MSSAFMCNVYATMDLLATGQYMKTGCTVETLLLGKLLVVEYYLQPEVLNVLYSVIRSTKLKPN
jgi:hypothetical protein